MTPDQILEKLKSLRGTMSTAQLVSLVASFVGVMGAVIAFAFWLNQPTYRVLFSDMDAESASAVTERLRAQDVRFRITDGGRSIQVPADQLDQLRLDFAGAGLPQSGRLGFELFDRTQFGATEFLEGVTYRRALEGEIARTLASIAEVSSARVHIAMAKDSLFQAKEQPAKASVVLRLKSSMPLSPRTVTGIRRLVAFGVEGLRPELVTILDTQGRPLTNDDDGDDAPLGATQLGRQQQFEHEQASAVVALLEPVVGVGRVRVNVAARLNIDTEDRLEERWEPTVVVRSHEVHFEGSGGVGASQGIAGARANLPEAAPPGSNTPAAETQVAPATTATTGGAQRTSEVTNNEITKLTVHTQRPRGDVARLSVAVILDDAVVVSKAPDGSITRDRKPRDPAELQKINSLVAGAVGLDTERGDQLVVENIAFEQQADEEPVAPPVALTQRVPMWGWVGLGVGAVVLVGGLAFVVLGRRRGGRVRRGEVTPDALGATEMLPPPQFPKTIEQIEGEIAHQLDIEAQNSGGDRRVPVMAKRLSGAIDKDSEAAARLLRTWLTDEKRA